jgi:hypothetical protein
MQTLDEPRSPPLQYTIVNNPFRQRILKENDITPPLYYCWPYPNAESHREVEIKPK